MTPEEISQEFGYELMAVKAALLQCSAPFRKEAKKDAAVFSDEEAEEMKSILLNLARYSDDENLQFKAAKYIRDDHKGRLDIAKTMPGLNISVIAFNEQMKKAYAAINRGTNKEGQKALVDV